MTVNSEPPPVAPRPIEDVIAELVSGHTESGRSLGGRLLGEMSRIDHSVYNAIASTPSPTLDAPIRWLSDAANRSLLWVGAAGALAVVGGPRGRRAAGAGLASVAVSSAVVNLGIKNLWARERPDRTGAGVVAERRTDMPASSSFPSGHSASGFAFATAVGREIPWLAFPLRALAAAVAYSRVHSGVHFPGDALAGSLAGGAVGLLVGAEAERVERALSRRTMRPS